MPNDSHPVRVLQLATTVPFCALALRPCASRTSAKASSGGHRLGEETVRSPAFAAGFRDISDTALNMAISGSIFAVPAVAFVITIAFPGFDLRVA